MVSLSIAVIGGISAGARGSPITWVLGGITVAMIAAGLAVAASTGLPGTMLALFLAIAGYNLGLVAGLILLAWIQVRSP